MYWFRFPLSLDDIHVQWRLDVDIASQGNMNDLGENATPESHLTPRKRLLQNLSDLLYKDNNIDGSLMTRLNLVSSNPFNQLLEPERVTTSGEDLLGQKILEETSLHLSMLMQRSVRSVISLAITYEHVPPVIFNKINGL